MSSDIAALYIKVDSTGVVTASKDLAGLEQAAAKTEGATKKVETATASANRSFTQMATAVKALAVSYGALKMAQYIKDATMLAARYEMLGVTMRVAGNTAGYTGAQMEKAAQGMQKMGISMIASRENAMKMVVAQLDLAKAADLARVAQDVARVANINSSEAFTRMIQGIRSGEVEIFKTMGLMINMDKAYRDFEKTNNLAKGSIDAGQRAQAVMNAVLVEGEKYAGLYAATMDTAAGQTLSMQRHVENLKVAFGLAFTPALAETIENITGAVKDLNGELSGNSKEKITEWGTKFRIAIISVEAEIRRLAMLLDKLGGTMTSAQMLLYGPGKALGVKSSTERFDRAADANMEYEARYKANEAALEALAKKQIELEQSLTAEGKKAAKAAVEAAEAKVLAAQKAAEATKKNVELTEKEIAAAQKLREEWIKLKAELEFEKATAGMDDLDKKLAEIERDMAKMRSNPNADLKLIDEIELQRQSTAIKAWYDEYLQEQIKAKENFDRQEKAKQDSIAKGAQETLDAIQKQYDADGQLLRDKLELYKDLEGFEDEYRQVQLAWIERIKEEEIKASGDVAAAEKKAAKDRAQIEYNLFKTKTDYIASGFGQLQSAFTDIAGIYEKGSDAARDWENAAKAMEIAQKAVAVVQAVGAIATQGLGDPYTAFARIAAMAATMGALLASIGTSIGGSGGGSASAPSYKFSSSVLGGEEGELSESLKKSWEFLEDTYDMEYEKLTKIHNELKDLNDNITGLVTSIIRTGSVGAIPFEANDPQAMLNFMNSDLGFALTSPLVVLGPLGKMMSDGLNKFLEGIFGGGAFAVGKTELWSSSSGIKIGGGRAADIANGAGVNARSYQEWTTRTTTDFWREDSYDYNYREQALAQETQDLFNSVFKNVSEVLAELAVGLGQDVNAAMNYVFSPATINLAGMSAEQISDTLNAYISSVGDTAVQTLFGTMLRGYQQLGEGLMETAVRLMVDKEIVLEVLEKTGQSYVAATDKTIAFSESLIKLAGDLETLTDIAATYYDKFYSEGEKHLRLQEQLATVLSSLNMVLPATRSAYRQLVEGLDLTTTTGQEAYVALLKLASGADAYYSTLEEGAEKIKTAAELMAEAIDTVFADLNSAMDAQISQSRKMASQFRSLSNTYQSITESLSAAQNEINGRGAAGAAGRFDALMAGALTGDAQSMQGLPQAAKELLAESQKSAGSAEEYKRIQGQVLLELEKARIISVAHTNWYDYFATVFDTQTGLLEEIKENLQLPTPDLDLLEKQAELLTNISKLLEGQTAQIVSGNNLQALILHDQTGKIILANQLTTDQTGQIVLGNNWLTDLSGATKFGIAVAAAQAKDAIEATNEGAASTTASVTDLKAASVWMMAQEYFLERAGQSEAATQAAKAIQATAKVSELIAGGVDINSAEKINEYLREVETALIGNNTWEAIQARKAMAEIRKTTEDGLLTTAEAETTKAALKTLQDVTTFIGVAQYNLAQTGQSEAATQAANAIAATAKVSELIAGGVDINSAEKINEYLRDVETALIGNNTWEAIQARKAMAEIRKTTEDGLLTTAEAEATKAALKTLQDVTTFIGVAQYNLAQTGQSEAATQAANAIAATAKVSELIAGGVDINSAEKINEYLRDVETALIGNNTWEAIQARKAMAEIRKTTEDGLLTTAEAEATTKALGQLQDSTAIQLMYQYSATKTGLSGVQTALNGQTVEIVNGNVVIKDQNGLIVSSNQLLKDQTGKIVIGNDLTDDQTAQVITGNATSDLIATLQKLNTDYSAEMLDALISRETEQTSSLEGILKANQTTVSLIRQLVDLTNQSQKEKYAAEIAAAKKEVEPLAITAWTSAIKANEAQAAVETARSQETEAARAAAIAESDQARKAYAAYVQTLGAYGQFDPNYSERQEDLSSGTPFAASGYWTYGAQTANNNALYAAYLKEFNEAYAMRDYVAPDSAASVSAAITTAQAAAKQASTSLAEYQNAQKMLLDLVVNYQTQYGELPPGYASGGDFSGGLRLVGEQGPELEYTGPSHIVNASKTEAFMSSNKELVAEIKKLNAKVDKLEAGNYQIVKNTLKTAKTLEKFDYDGTPIKAWNDTPITIVM